MEAFAQGIDGFATALRQGKVTCEQAMRQCLARIGAMEPTLGAFRRVREGAALLAEARALDMELASGHDRGALMGVPIAVKEIVAVQGMGCSVNSALDVTDLLPTQGPFVRALRAAGCIVVGTTTSTEFALATLNWNDPGPWNPVDATTRRLCGGSSHGSAVAVAARLCAFAVGTDTGGSVRVPAALCGVVGYKSTRGAWSTEGVFPAAPSLDSMGVFAASVADCVAVARQVGPGVSTPTASVAGLRLGLWEAPEGEPLDAAVQNALAWAGQALRQAGAQVLSRNSPATTEAAQLFSRLMPAEFARVIGPERLRAGTASLDPVTAARASAEIDMDTEALHALECQLAQARRTAAPAMAGLDAWIGATTPVLASPRSDLRCLDDALRWNRRIGQHTRPVNVFDQCAISLPLPTPAGLPAGLQIVCGHREDARLLSIAQAIEGVLARAAAAGPAACAH